MLKRVQHGGEGAHMAIAEILITAGVVAVLAAIAGGGLKGFGVEVPLLASLRRQIALLVVGAALLGLGLYQARENGPAKAPAEPQPVNAAASVTNNLAAITPPPAAPAAAAARPDMPNIVDLPFPTARQFLIQNAWSPINSATTPMAMQDKLGLRAGEMWDAGYREAVACSGSALAPCTFRYRHPSGAILEVVAVGEDIKTAIVNDARILDCKAEPKPDGCAW
jgi:hypothetical protein